MSESPDAPETVHPSYQPEGSPKALLEVDHVTLKFGGLTALNDVSFNINEGEILGLIGPNGAGKTTCFNVMTGVYRPTSGQVRFDGDIPACLALTGAADLEAAFLQLTGQAA